MSSASSFPNAFISSGTRKLSNESNNSDATQKIDGNRIQEAGINDDDPVMKVQFKTDVLSHNHIPSTTFSICTIDEALSRIDEAARLSPVSRESIANRSHMDTTPSALLPSISRCYIPRRYIVTILSFLAFAVIYAIRSSLSVAIVQMTSKTDRSNGEKGTQYFNWDSIEQGEVLGAFFYGYIITQMPGGWFAARFGGKYVLFFGILGTSMFTLLMPPAAQFGKTGLMVTRALQGLFQGVSYPTMHAILGNWAPKLEETLMSGIVYGGSYFGTVVAMPLSAYLGNWGWPAIFYFFGATGVLWCILWLFLFNDEPAKMPGISKEELTLYGREKAEQKESFNVPWLYIFRSKEVWCIVVCHFCQNCGFYAMLTQIPSILENFLNYEHHMAGILAAIPYLAMGLTISFAGIFLDSLRTHYEWWTTVRTRKIFCFCGFVGSALTLLPITINTHRWIKYLGMIASLGFSGFSFLSFSAGILDIAPQHAGHVMGLSNTLATVPGFVVPLFVGAIVTDQQLWQWRIVFYVIAGIYTFGAFLFVIVAKCEVLNWARKQDTTQQHNTK